MLRLRARMVRRHQIVLTPFPRAHRAGTGRSDRATDPRGPRTAPPARISARVPGPRSDRRSAAAAAAAPPRVRRPLRDRSPSAVPRREVRFIGTGLGFCRYLASAERYPLVPASHAVVERADRSRGAQNLVERPGLRNRRELCRMAVIRRLRVSASLDNVRPSCRVESLKIDGDSPPSLSGTGCCRPCASRR
jgi:hypothetical protein